MGRPTKPTNLKVLHGDRGDRINRSEPVPGQSGVERPGWLVGVAAETWDKLAPDLVRQGVLTPWDVDAFAMACDQVRIYREAADVIGREGMTAEGMKGGQVKHPLLQVQRDALTSFATLAGRFGLTPSDRAKLSIGGSDEPKGAERLLS